MPDRPIKIELYHGDVADGPAHHTDGTYGWRWTARRGGRIIAASTEAYGQRIAAVDNISLVFGVPLRRLVKPGARTINVTFRRGEFDTVTGGQPIEVKTR